MTGAIRNSCVARGVGGQTGNTNLYNVPSGYVLLLKDVRLQNTGGASIVYSLNVTAAGVVLLPFVSGTLATNALSGYAGWIALNAGDALILSVSVAGTVAYWVSGALLPNIP